MSPSCCWPSDDDLSKSVVMQYVRYLLSGVLEAFFTLDSLAIADYSEGLETADASHPAFILTTSTI